MRHALMTALVVLLSATVSAQIDTHSTFADYDNAVGGNHTLFLDFETDSGGNDVVFEDDDDNGDA